jgi:hypothetical protein
MRGNPNQCYSTNGHQAIMHPLPVHTVTGYVNSTKGSRFLDFLDFRSLTPEFRLAKEF